MSSLKTFPVFYPKSVSKETGGSINGTNPPEGSRKNNDFDFEPGFRISTEAPLCNGTGSFALSYTRLNADQSRRVTGTDLFDTLLNPLGIGTAFNSYPGSAHSQLDLLYQQIAATMKFRSYSNCGLNVGLTAGVEWAYLRLNQNVQYVRTDNDVSGSIHDKSRFNGFGPQLGGEFSYELGHYDFCLPGCLTFVGSASGGLLVGEQSTEENQRVSTGTTLRSNDGSSWRMIPAVHMSVGVDYATHIWCYPATLGLSYEFHSYIRGLARVDFPDDVTSGRSFNKYDNIDFHGFTFSAGMTF